MILFSIWPCDPPSEDEPDCYIMTSEIFASLTKLEKIFLRNLAFSHPHQLFIVSNFSVSAPSIRSLRIDARQCSPSLMTQFIYLFPSHGNDQYSGQQIIRPPYIS